MFDILYFYSHLSFWFLFKIPAQILKFNLYFDASKLRKITGKLNINDVLIIEMGNGFDNQKTFIFIWRQVLKSVLNID